VEGVNRKPGGTRTRDCADPGPARPRTVWGFKVRQDEFPDSEHGFVVTHFLVVADQDRSRDFYESVFGAKVVRNATLSS
jgi:hypothetical protein